MRMRIVCAVLACAVLAPPLVSQAWARWTHVRTPNFLFIGDASEGDIRRLADTLEGFRRALIQALPGANSRSPVPTVVIVFGSDRSFTPYKPRFQGRAVDAAGYFLSGEDINYIVIDASEEADAFRVVFHEYAHFLTDNGAGLVPLWASEGLAQFYETFELRERGRAAALGLAIPEHVMFLRDNNPMPLTELLSIDDRSPVYNEGDRRGLFYAQSWALVHYLTLGNVERAPQLRDYLTRVATGTAPDRAFAESFRVPPATIERELRDYVRRFTFPAVRLALDAGAVEAVPRGTTIPDADAEAVLGDLLARQGRGTEARALLERVLQREPVHARAMMALALMDLQDTQIDAAIQRLQRAAELAPGDGAIHAALGRAWVDRVGQEQERERQIGALREARTALTRAAELEPEIVHTQALLGYAEASLGDDLSKAVGLLEAAVARAPAREPYRLMLADALMRHGDYDRATAHLGLLVARGSREAVRENARTLLGRLASLRAAREARDARAAAAARPSPPALAVSDAAADRAAGDARLERPAAAPAPPAGANADPRAAEDAAAPRVIPLLRDLKPIEGEVRVLGTFQHIDCGSDGQVTIHVVTDGGVLRLHTARFSDIEFIAYIPNPPASVTCGAVPDAPRVLATYRPAAAGSGSGDGTAVAIELIPAHFEPR